MGLGMESSWQRAGRKALNLIFPPLCIACREQVSEPGSLCPNCWQTLHFLDGPVCSQCGLPFEFDPGGETLCVACIAHPPAFDKARAIMRYDDASKKPILALKHADRLDLVPSFGRWLERSGRELLAGSDLIVPVPLHRLRLWMRRYNQSAELARALSRIGSVPVDSFVLSRTRRTLSQGEMPSASARRRNVRGAFTVPERCKSVVEGRKILLIDDVMTTGATVNACAKALKRAGAANVYVLALARVVRPLSDAV
jgi:ComF family protein